jgi:hypothetical protein
MCWYQFLVPSRMVCNVWRASMVSPPAAGMEAEGGPPSLALAASAVSFLMAMIRAASLAVASADRRGVLAAIFLPAAFSAAVCAEPAILTLSAIKDPGHKTAGTLVEGVAGAAAGENLTGLPLPAAAFKLARSFGITGLALKEGKNKLAEEEPKNEANQVGGSLPLLGGDFTPQNLVLRLSGDGGFLLLLKVPGGDKLALLGPGSGIVIPGGQVLLRQGAQLDSQNTIIINTSKVSKSEVKKGSALPLELDCHV